MFFCIKGSFWFICSKKGYFCTFFKEFIIIDIDMKFSGLNKYILEIDWNFFIYFKHFLCAKMTGKREGPFTQNRFCVSIIIPLTSSRSRVQWFLAILTDSRWFFWILLWFWWFWINYKYGKSLILPLHGPSGKRNFSKSITAHLKRKNQEYSDSVCVESWVHK